MVIQPHSKIPRPLHWASKWAELSPHPVHRMGAVVVRGGNLIGHGWNKNHSHPRSNSYDNTIHAELAAIISAGAVFGSLEGHLYVARITKGGALATSKPCGDCMDLIKEAGIEKVTYIDVNGYIKKENL